MAIISSAVLLYAAATLAAAVAALFIYFKISYRHWLKRGIPQTNPKFPLGDLQGIRRTKAMGKLLGDLYNQYPDQKIVGFYGLSKPMLLIRDPDILKDILVRSFSSFHDRGIEIDTKVEPLLEHLFALKGQDWRNLRVKLTPTFTSGKIKMMFPTAAAVGDTLIKVLNMEVDKGGIVDVKEYLARFTTDIIATTVFGIEINCLENPDNEFRVHGKNIIGGSLRQSIVGTLIFTMPRVAALLKLKFLTEEASSFFIKVVKDTVMMRQEKNIHRNDFMQSLIQLLTKGFIEDVDADKTQSPKQGASIDFTIEKATAQAILFFSAGFETSTSTMLFTLYELALHPDLQTKLQAEIDDVIAQNGGKMSYENVNLMHLLDRVVSETLRKYPVADFLVRECTADYQVPDSDIIIKKGDFLNVSLAGLQNDPKYYPNPEKFDPDRFLPEEKEKRNSYTYMPFGEGPRACIGNRFALMQTKFGLTIILSTFKVEVCDKTVIPPILDASVDIMTPLNGMHLRLSKRHKLS